MVDNSSEESVSIAVIEYSLLLLVELISLMSILMIFIYVLLNWNRMVTRSLHNHALLLIILTSFFYNTLDLPFTISSYRLGYDVYRSQIFCQWWYWIDYSLIGISLLLTAVASIQRYVFIFKHTLLRIPRTRWLLHYFPLIFSLIHPPVFYCIVIFFYNCAVSLENEGDNLFCSHPCYSWNHVLYNVDWMIHAVLPLFVIAVSHGILLSWIIIFVRKLNGQQRILWKKQKKATFQLFAFACLFVLGWAPSTIVSVIESLFSLDLHGSISPLSYLYYISYFICPLQPLLCLLILPEPLRFIRDQLCTAFAPARVNPMLTLRQP